MGRGRHRRGSYSYYERVTRQQDQRRGPEVDIVDDVTIAGSDDPAEEASLAPSTRSDDVPQTASTTRSASSSGPTPAGNR